MGVISRFAAKTAKKEAAEAAEAAEKKAAAKAARTATAAEKSLAAKPTASKPEKSLAAKAEQKTVPAVPRGSDFAIRRKPKRTTPADREVITPGAEGVDPRIENRAGEVPKVTSMTVERTKKTPVVTPDPLASLFQHEGRGVITSMSDLSDAGSVIHAINDVEFDHPLETLGGQGYMFNTPDQVWAMDKNNAERHAALAAALRQETGKDPIFAPWLMGQRSIDFSHMPREAMLRYGMANMNAKGRNRLTDTVRHFVPEFRDPSDPASMEAFLRASGRARFGLNKALDQFRDAGGLGLGAARLATSSPELLGSRLTGLHNIGLIDARSPLGVSNHFSYDTGLHGQGLGTLSNEERRLGALALLPDIMYEHDMLDPFDFPVGVVPGVKSPLRAMQMGPKGSIITDNTLRRLEQLIDRRNWYIGAED